MKKKRKVQPLIGFEPGSQDSKTRVVHLIAPPYAMEINEKTFQCYWDSNPGPRSDNSSLNPLPPMGHIGIVRDKNILRESSKS